MKPLACLSGLIGLSMALSAQVPGATPPGGISKTRVLPAGTAPVTESEARAVFARAEGALRHALLMPATTSAGSIPSGTAPVRREQVILEMTRLYGVIERKVKMTPAPTPYDPGVLRMSNRQALVQLNRFVRMGAVARVGPLATGPKDTLTVPEFGDAIGFFLARMAELTHLPNSKWTPELQPPGS